MHHKSHVLVVDAHAESDCGAHNCDAPCIAHQKRLGSMSFAKHLAAHDTHTDTLAFCFNTQVRNTHACH